MNIPVRLYKNCGKRSFRRTHGDEDFLILSSTQWWTVVAVKQNIWSSRNRLVSWLSLVILSCDPKLRGWKVLSPLFSSAGILTLNPFPFIVDSYISQNDQNWYSVSCLHRIQLFQTKDIDDVWTPQTSWCFCISDLRKLNSCCCSLVLFKACIL